MFMRAPAIIGIILIIVGGYLFVSGGTFTTKRDVLKVGDLKVSADEKRSVEPWMAGVIVAVGAGILVMGARKKA